MSSDHTAVRFIDSVAKSLRTVKIDGKLLKNDTFQIWIIVLIFSILSASLIIPRFYMIRPDFQIGAIAKQDIKADRDFMVEDIRAAQKRKLEAIKKIPRVFDFDGDIPSQINANLARAFLLMAEFPGSQDAKINFENTLNIVISRDEFLMLKKYRFAPALAENISSVIKGFYHQTYVVNDSLSKQDVDNGIIIRNVKTNVEEHKTDLAGIITVKGIESRLRLSSQKILSASDDQAFRKVFLAIARRLIQTNLTFNNEATEIRKQQAIKDVKPVYFQILKNEMLVREGQRITAEEANTLETYFRLKGERHITVIAKFIGICLLIMLLSYVLFHAAKNWLSPGGKKSDVLLLAVTSLLQIVLVKTGIFISQAINMAFPVIHTEVLFFAIPFGVGAMLIAVLLNQNVALAFSFFSALILGFFFEGQMLMPIFLFVGSVFVAAHISHGRKRSAFLRSGLFLGLINSLTILIIGIYSGEITFPQIFLKAMMGIIGGILAGFIVAGITPLFEGLFDYTTDIKLLELANLNHPLFQKMIMEAPGTYHHSIIVGSLVESASEAIGAKSLLAKVSAYYHDIGKMKKPQYYIENQQTGDNKHDRISPKMSSLVIISHVKDGCDLAEKMRLGKEISSIIRQHHGTSLVRYFWEKAKKENDFSLNSISESDFQYPGPKPQTREAGLVLLGDVIEASSRILSNPTPSRIKNLVRERIQKVFTDGQLDDCELTLRDLNLIAESFTRILNGIFHHRIDYPESGVRDLSEINKKEYNGHTDRKFTEKSKA